MKGISQKIVAITGATGLIGSALNLHLTKNGYLVKVLKRGFAQSEINGCDIVINLAGSTINCRWTTSAKTNPTEPD